MTRKKGVFIVLEGPDRSGKSTQAALLVRRLRRSGMPVVHTREPGGTGFAEAIRKILLDPRHRVHPLAELLLYEAARAQHTQETILPALRAGKIVVCERYTLATLAYQGHARGLGLGLVRAMNRVATGGLRADATLVLDMAQARFHDRAQGRRPDRLEQESERFRRRVRAGYLRLSKTEPGTTVISGNVGIEETHESIYRRVRGLGGIGAR